MPTYFADTAFWIAPSSRRDQYHSLALAWHAALVRNRSKIITTEAVLWEWLNALADASTLRVAAEGYRRVHGDARVEVVPLELELAGAAVCLYASRPDRDWSLTDCLSFEVMGQRGLSDALTTDRHFGQAGMKAIMLTEPDI